MLTAKKSHSIIGVNKVHFDLEYFGGKGLKITPIVKNDIAEISVEVFVKKLAETDGKIAH